MISKLAKEKKHKELMRLKKMTPQERLKAQARLNVRIKKLFFAGLRSRGFEPKEIARLWKSK
jgi:uncharacterized membrane protein